MKIFHYFLLVIFTITYAIGFSIDIFMFLFGGLGGPYTHWWVIPTHLIFGTVFFIMYVLSIKPGALHSVFKIYILPILLFLILPLPILFTVWMQYESDKARSDFAETCRIVELEGFKYEFCSGHPGTFGPGVSVIGLSPGDSEFGKAMKIWDEKGWLQFKSETDWYYKK